MGACILDGADLGDVGDAGPGVIASPLPDRGGRYFVVHDVDTLGLELERAVNAGGVSPELAAMLEGVDAYALEAGDVITWWSSPWDDEPIADALEHTLDYDVGDLMAAMAWPFDKAADFVESHGIVRLGDTEIADWLPVDMHDRTTNTMRPNNTWQLRVERGNEVRFLYFVASATVHTD